MEIKNNMALYWALKPNVKDVLGQGPKNARTAQISLWVF